MPVPVADSQLRAKTAASGVGVGDDRRHAHARGCAARRPGTAAIEMPSSNALICGRPQTKTSTLRMTHGVQALMTCARVKRVPPAARCASACDVVRLADVLGPRRRRLPDSQEQRERAHRDDAATTSTSHGPWKFETRNCGIGEGHAGDQDRRPDLQHPRGSRRTPRSARTARSPRRTAAAGRPSRSAPAGRAR